MEHEEYMELRMNEDGKRSIDDIVHQLVIRRVEFKPPESELRLAIFNQNCDYLESKSVDPLNDLETLHICMKADYVKILQGIDEIYWKYPQILYIDWKYGGKN
jgi:hypothetical protein